MTSFLSLSLDKQILRFKENIPYITYGQEIPDEYMELKLAFKTDIF